MGKLRSFEIEAEMMPKVIELLTNNGFKELKRQPEHSLYDFIGVDFAGKSCFIESRVRTDGAKTQNLIMPLSKFERLKDLSKVAPVYLIFLNRYGHTIINLEKLKKGTLIRTGHVALPFELLLNKAPKKFLRELNEGATKTFGGLPPLGHNIKRIEPLTPEKEKELVGIFSRRVNYDAVKDFLNLGCWVFFHSVSRQHVWAIRNKLRKEIRDVLVFKAKLGSKDGYAFVRSTKGKRIPTALVGIKYSDSRLASEEKI